jgi:hypothetical protein
MVSTSDSGVIHGVGKSFEERIVSGLGAEPTDTYASLADLKNLQGESTGYVKGWSGDRLVKAVSLSISVGPGRYFNIHLIPEARYDAPRLLFEGMLMPGGSQVSVELFSDVDVVTNFERLNTRYQAVTRIYEEARLDERILLEPSRQPHMRAFASPWFLLVSKTPDATLPVLEGYAKRYFDAWLDVLQSAQVVSDEDAAAKQAWREYLAESIIKHDTDRPMVVQVYGEETVSCIEDAMML